MYKKKIDELRNRKNTDFFNDLCVRLDNAVGYYFDGSESGIPQAIQNIGIMNEHIMRAVIRSFEPIWKENEKDQNRRLKNSMKVYVLWHIHELNDDYGPHDEEKLIGIHSIEEHHNGIN